MCIEIQFLIQEFANQGGIATVYTGQPLDTIKVKMQMFPNLYKNALQCGLETFKRDGIYRGLYAGTVPALAANVSGNLIFCKLKYLKSQPSYLLIFKLKNY